MTMQHPVHPDDERLAALAGDDPEAASDGRLVEHVAGCDRCGPLVADLRRMRSALAELPDLRPSRPLQLVPPVRAPRAADSGPLGWLRRLAAPAMVAGVGLALVGGVGLGAMALQGAAAGGAAIFQNVGDNLTNGDAEHAPGAESLAPARGSDGQDEEEVAGRPLIDLSTPVPWLAALVVGAAMFLLALLLRFAIRPRAG